MDGRLEEKTKKLLDFFKGDKFVESSGIVIRSVDEKCAVVTAEVDEKHLNANGCVQGGMLYTLADFAFAVHANFLHYATVTQCGHINYVRPAVCKTLTATAVETLRSGKTCLSEVTVQTESGEVVCVCNFNGFIKEKEL